MKIRTIKDAWIVTFVVTGVACVIVTSTILMVYPPEDWPFELTISFVLTVTIASPVTYFMSRQLLTNWELSAELTRLVNRDRLTDVATRDYFFARMAAAPQAYGVSLMVDIDHFKMVNDTYGHLAGDKVIREVATLMKSAVNPDDIVARFGGEEFVVFLHDHDQSTGHIVAERMRFAIAERPIQYQGITLNVTVSIGCSLKATCDGIEAAIQASDAALYRAKAAGRNRTVFAEVGQKDLRLTG